ncbi:MAG: hypothetical protein J6D00_03865 [Christensenellaceae bacterium]|nr:hypothetical protein [Christensenellaceae bacterium]
MANIISEGYDVIGRIDDNGFIFDNMGNMIAEIQETGLITQPADGEIYGMIHSDGTICDESFNDVIGRIQANGEVIIHSHRVCRVSSAFIEKITPDAWNADEIESYSGRQVSDDTYEDDASDYGGSGRFFSFGTIVKLVIGVILGIYLMIQFELGIVAIPVGVLLVFAFSFFVKLFG